jgi:hypothetical protein
VKVEAVPLTGVVEDGGVEEVVGREGLLARSELAEGTMGVTGTGAGSLELMCRESPGVVGDAERGTTGKEDGVAVIGTGAGSAEEKSVHSESSAAEAEAAVVAAVGTEEDGEELGMRLLNMEEYASVEDQSNFFDSLWRGVSVQTKRERERERVCVCVWL